MISSDQRSRFRVPLASNSTSTHTRTEPKCHCCGQALRLFDAPILVPAGYRIEPTAHVESGERDVSRFGVCAQCCLVFEDVNGVMQMYEQVRQQVLLAVHRSRLARELFDSGRGDVPAALGELAAAFVCLKRAPGVRPFSVQQLTSWMCDTALGASTRYCAAFVLHVADASSCWARQFDVVSALEHWEPAQRAVFIEWAKAPWWA